MTASRHVDMQSAQTCPLRRDLRRGVALQRAYLRQTCTPRGARINDDRGGAMSSSADAPLRRRTDTANAAPRCRAQTDMVARYADEVSAHTKTRRISLTHLQRAPRPEDTAERQGSRVGAGRAVRSLRRSCRRSGEYVVCSGTMGACLPARSQQHLARRGAGAGGGRTSSITMRAGSGTATWSSTQSRNNAGLWPGARTGE